MVLWMASLRTPKGCQDVHIISGIFKNIFEPSHPRSSFSVQILQTSMTMTRKCRIRFSVQNVANAVKGLFLLHKTLVSQAVLLEEVPAVAGRRSHWSMRATARGFRHVLKPIGNREKAFGFSYLRGAPQYVQYVDVWEISAPQYLHGIITTSLTTVVWTGCWMTTCAGWGTTCDSCILESWFLSSNMSCWSFSLLPPTLICVPLP